MLWVAVLFALTLGAFLDVSPATAQDIVLVFESDEVKRTVGTNEFVHPVWMAVVADGQGARILVGNEDPIFLDRDPWPIGVVRKVGPDGLSLTRIEGGRMIRLTPGRSLPGTKDLVFREAVLVKTLEYRHRVLGRGERKLLDGELYLVGLQGTRAILQRDIDPPPSPTELMERRLAALQIAQAGPRVWEVNARDIQAAMESGETIMNHALGESRIDISGTRGIGLELKTPIADVRLDRRGFLITSPNLASRAGLQIGDRVLGVNDMPIDGFGSLFQAYQAIKRNSAIRTVTLTIERSEKPVTFTYRIR